MSNLEEFWLISVPGEKTPQQSWEKLIQNIHPIANPFKFQIPPLKVGTLDQLFGLSDELNKLDSYVENVTRKVAQYLSDVLDNAKDKIAENLLANNVECVAYVSKFEWDVAKYPIKQSLKSLSEIISKQISLIENDLKSKSNQYNAIKQSLQQLQKKQTGSLITRNLGDIVKKEDFLLNSEYLITVLVIVPRNNIDEWFTCYESLCEYIVPRSSKKIYEDNEQILVNVIMFEKVLDTFKVKCREKKFAVRDFKYNEQALLKESEQLKILEQNRKDKFGPLVRWLQINFSESFTAWIHVKALRLFVESVLRYGLPVNFQAAIIQPHKKKAKQLRETLNNLFMHLDTSDEICGKKDLNSAVEISALMGNQDYYPYVYLHLSLDFIDSQNKQH